MGSGIVLNLLPRTDYDFANVQAGKTMQIWLAQNIDATRYREASLAVRLHTASVTGAGSPLLSLKLFGVAPTLEDPAPAGGFFRDASPKLTVTAYSTVSPAAPALVTGTMTGFWGLLSLQLDVKQLTTITTHSCTLSVDLNLKDA